MKAILIALSAAMLCSAQVKPRIAKNLDQTGVSGGSTPNQVLEILEAGVMAAVVYTTPVADKDSVVFGPCKDTSGNVYTFSIDTWSTTGATLSIAPAAAPAGGVKCGVNTGGGAAVAGAYNATTWNADTDAPTKDAVRDQFEAIAPAGQPKGDDTAYDATSWNGNTDAPTKNAVRDKIEALGGGHTQNTDTGTTATCFQINSGASGPKACDDGSGGWQFKTSADVVFATISAAGVLTLGDGTAPWNLTGLTDDVAPSAPSNANEFTAYVDRGTGLFAYILNGGSAKYPALGRYVNFTGPTAARSYALPNADKTLLATDGSAADLTNFPTLNQDTTGTAAKVPQGASPTIDAVGKVGIDTTTDQFQFYGAAKRALPSIQHMSFAIPAPADTDDVNLMKAPYGMTIVGIDAIVQGTTSVTGQLQECASDGTSCADLDSDIVADADGAADDGSLTDSAIASGAWIRWKTTSVSGTPTFLTVTVRYRVVAD